jgi:O-antigen/teichoic acid export membrane protein
VLLAVPFWLSWNLAAALALALDHYEVSAAGALLSNLATLLLMGVLAPLAGLHGAILALALGQGLSALAFIAWGARRIGRPEHGWIGRARSQLARAVRFGGQTYLPAILQLLNYRADLFILAAVASRATVGHYSVALIVTELGMLAPRALAAVVLPRVARLDAEASEVERTMVELKSVRHTILLMVPTAVVLAVGVLAIPLVFGPGFSESVTPGLILIPGVLAVGAAGVLSAVIVGRGYPRYTLYSALAITPATLALYAFLISRLEATGAALASTASYLGSTAISLILFAAATKLPLTELAPRRDDLSDYRTLARALRARAAAP